MGTHVSILSTLKSLVSIDSAYRGKATFSTSTYTGGVPLTALGPTGERTADWSTVTGTPQLERVYRLCATAYACATFLADAVAESPLRVYRLDQGDPVELSDHRFRLLISNPNPYMSEAEFVSLTVMQMAFSGYAAIEKVRSAAGIPVQLWPLRTDWLTRETLNDGTARWIFRRPRMDPRVIADEDIILIPYRHDERQERVGVSPLHIVAREIGIDVALTDLLKVLLDAGGIPMYAVEFDSSMPVPQQDDVDIFREKWRQTFGGPSGMAQIGVMLPGMKLAKVGSSIGDLAWPELRGLTELKIAQAFRVPADLIQARDTLKSGSLATTEMNGAMAALQQYGATPLRQRIDGAFTRSLLPDFTGNDRMITVEFDISAILSLQEDRDALHVRVRGDWDSGAITLNQFLQETGRPELGTPGEIFKVPFNITYMPLNQLTGDSLPPVAVTAPKALSATTRKAIEYRNRKTMTAAEIETKANVMALTNRTRHKLAQILDRKLRAFWKEQGARVVAAMPMKSAGAIETKDTIMNWSEEEGLLRMVLDTFYIEAGKQAYSGVSTVTGIDLSFDLANPNIQNVIEQLGLRIVGISETTRLDVNKLVTDGLAEGMSPPQIAETLTGLFEETYKNRAGTVARTESMIAYNTASALGYQESGVEQVEMVDNLEHDSDYGASDGLTCAQRDGMVVNLADVGRHIEAEHPNGSLALIPLLSGPALGEV